ncbi:2496_t:CDS:1 [Funneliformis geosporum]|uniref:10787_t:CDS:1 n=1 Tax=Funneliformis geosporum TaxID=1117311 RepID=A0A9W4SI41_9GLOM|nr:10787_t:CDS:1 [Funneliformis geosporum]CAI2188083.1 2496_t:CDS:1 [Funneliformis geosporum]
MTSSNSISTPPIRINTKDFNQVIIETSTPPPDLKIKRATPIRQKVSNLHLNTLSNDSTSRPLSPSKLNVSRSPSRSSSPTNLNVPLIYSRPSSPSREHLKNATMKYVDDLLLIFYEALDNYPINQIIILIKQHLENNDQKEEKIFKWLLNNENDVKYRTLLGFFYEAGIGTEENERKAFNSYIAGAKMGITYSQTLLGNCYILGKGTAIDEVLGFKWYQKASETELCICGLCGLANCFDFGIGTGIDKKKAFDLYKKSIKTGKLLGLSELGYCYQVGCGVEKDLKKALEYYKQSAEQENSDGQYYLGVFYEFGVEIEIDVKQAINLYCQAAENGDDEAKDKLYYLLKG